jgi:arylsulfatase A-like enzyme
MFNRKRQILVLTLVVVLSILLWQKDRALWYLRYERSMISTPTNEPVSSDTQLSQIPPCEHCNVILISLDTLRASRVGFLGADHEESLTPNLDKIAGESLVFTNGFSNAFFTTPSHMTLFTSLYPTTHKVAGTTVGVPRLRQVDGTMAPLDSKFKTLAETLKGQGYRTVWAGPLNFRHLSFDLGFSRGFDELLPSLFDRGLFNRKDRESGFDIPGLKKIFSNEKKPFFIFMHSYANHLPYVMNSVTPGYDFLDTGIVPLGTKRILDAVTAAVRDKPRAFFTEGVLKDKSVTRRELIKSCTNYADMTHCFNDLVGYEDYMHAIGQWQLNLMTSVMQTESLPPKAREVEKVRLAAGYDANVRFADQQIGQLWSALKEFGALNNTIIIIVSDHGEELFDHGEGSHSSFHEHTVRVPIMFYVPGLKQGIRSKLLTSLIDVMPGLLDLLKVPAPPQQLQGHSVFNPINQGQFKHVFGYSLGTDYVRDFNWKLTRSWDGSQELFHELSDPAERTNLIDRNYSPSLKAQSALEDARGRWESEQAL